MLFLVVKKYQWMDIEQWTLYTRILILKTITPKIIRESFKNKKWGIHYWFLIDKLMFYLVKGVGREWGWPPPLVKENSTLFIVVYFWNFPYNDICKNLNSEYKCTSCDITIMGAIFNNYFSKNQASDIIEHFVINAVIMRLYCKPISVNSLSEKAWWNWL